MANVSNKKGSKLQNNKNNSGLKKRSRFFPVVLAGLICAVTSVAGGYGAWYFFSVKANGQENRQKVVAKLTDVFVGNKVEPFNAVSENKTEIVSQPNPEPTPVALPKQSPEQTPIIEITPTENKEETSAPKEPIIDGVVFVKGGEVNTGGDKTEKPLKRTFVNDFYIAETEVTNKQYALFVSETKRKPPIGWNSKTGFPNGMDEFPVTHISYQDAESFCIWLSKKNGVEIRLPNEVEWERAAKGENNFIYPWGNDWEKNAATVRGKVGKVKSFEKNKSPFGAYDMAGNVWELTSDVELNSNQKPVYTNKQLNRIVRGGSALEDGREFLVTTRWDTVPDSEIKRDNIGFRYVVVIKTNE